jgi:phage I-like protein
MARPLTSDAFRWVYATETNLASWRRSLDQFHQMAKPSVVVGAAKQGGRVIQTRAQDLIYGQTGLQQYEAVAERIQVWDDNQGVWVGVKPDDPALPEAEAMDQLFPVLDTAFEMSGADARARFEQALEEEVF